MSFAHEPFFDLDRQNDIVDVTDHKAKIAMMTSRSREQMILPRNRQVLPVSPKYILIKIPLQGFHCLILPTRSLKHPLLYRGNFATTI